MQFWVYNYLLDFESLASNASKYKLIVNTQKSIYNLQIFNAQLEDEGVYQCQAVVNLDYNIIRASANLSIIGKHLF